MLFSALSVEAYANELGGLLLEAGDAKPIDRLPVVDKLLLTPQLAALPPVLDRGLEPLQSVAALIRTRDRLVHPKPSGGLSTHVIDLEQEDERSLGPAAAATAIARVGQLI